MATYSSPSYRRGSVGAGVSMTTEAHDAWLESPDGPPSDTVRGKVADSYRHHSGSLVRSNWSSADTITVATDLGPAFDPAAATASKMLAVKSQRYSLWRRLVSVRLLFMSLIAFCVIAMFAVIFSIHFVKDAEALAALHNKYHSSLMDRIGSQLNRKLTCMRTLSLSDKFFISARGLNLSSAAARAELADVSWVPQWSIDSECPPTSSILYSIRTGETLLLSGLGRQGQTVWGVMGPSDNGMMTMYPFNASLPNYGRGSNVNWTVRYESLAQAAASNPAVMLSLRTNGLIVGPVQTQMVPATGQFSNFLPIGFVDVNAAGVPTALVFKAVSAIELNGFLQSVSDQQTSFSFIVDCGDGLLVSASKGATLIQLSMVSYRRLSPQESQASQISRAGRALLEKYGSYESVPSSTMTLEFEDTYFVEVQHYHVMGTRWLIVSGVSRSSVMGSIDEANFQTIIFSCAVFVLCLVIALVLTHLLVRPLARMRSQMQEVDRSPVDELTSGSKPDPLTFFIEVRRLQDSFTALQDAVRTITMYIPSFVSSMVFSEADSSKYDGRSPAYVAKQSSVVPFKCEPVAGLSSGKAVVLYVRIDGAEDLCHITDNGQFSSIIHELCETLGFIVSECNGVVDQLSLDHLTVYWLLSGDDKADICVIREAMACLARCQVAVEALRLSWSNRRWPLVNCRFGMHVAEALIGSFGSKYRMTYGIAGDAVVVARQLASLCEICEVSSLVSFEGLGATSTIVDDLVFRHVCLIFLPHVREQLSLFTLLPDSVPLRDRIQLAATFKNALDLFYSRDFESSMLAFGRFQSMFKRYFESGDKLADYYLQMCDNAVENGVPEEWQGAFTVARGREEWQLV